MNYIQRPNLNNYPVVKNLLIVNFAVYILTFIIHAAQGYDLGDVLNLYYFQGDNFKPHQLITSMFMHAPLWEGEDNIFHILFNMYGLWMFGQILESYWGSKRFFTYYMICGVGSGIVQELAWYFYYHDHNSLISLGHNIHVELFNALNACGASGAIFGILVAFGVIFPNIPLYIMFIPVPVKAKWLVLGYGLWELFGGIRNSAGDNVAHYAHIGGILFGLLLLYFWRKKKKKY